MIYNASLIFYHAQPIIIKVIFSFLKFVWVCKKSAHFINSFLRYADLPKRAHPFFTNTMQNLLK